MPQSYCGQSRGCSDVSLTLLCYLGGLDGLDDCVDAELTPVAIASDDVLAFAFEEDAETDVEVGERRKPDFVVNSLLFEGESGAFVDGCEEASELDVVEEAGVESSDLLGSLVDPEGATELLGEFFRSVGGLNLGVGFEVKGK
jgi:hypothetical protein